VTENQTDQANEINTNPITPAQFTTEEFEQLLDVYKRNDPTDKTGEKGLVSALVSEIRAGKPFSDDYFSEEALYSGKAKWLETVELGQDKLKGQRLNAPTILSLLATDIKIGEDDQTKIDFETADEIHFYAANVEQVYLADNIFGPQSDSDVDLGSSSVRWKDAYVDSITVTGNADIDGDVDVDGTLETDALTIAGTAIVAQATASAVGGVELATAAEVITGTDAARVVTADTLSAKSVVCDIDVSSLTDSNIVTITHNLGTADILVQVYDKTTEANIMCDIARTTDDFSTASTSVVSIDFGTAPPNDCRALITSLAGATAGSIAYT